jgi:hypothetical protein
MAEELESNKYLDVRFEYAWRWFAFHARQRVSMFNFFLIGVGILANAYVLLMIQNIRGVAGSLAIIATLMCAVFVLLDRRNHQLVHLGEEILRQLEKNALFQSRITPTTQQEYAELGPLEREQRLGPTPFYLKHWFLMEGFQTMVGIAFAAAAIYAFLGVS